MRSAVPFHPADPARVMEERLDALPPRGPAVGISAECGFQSPAPVSAGREEASAHKQPGEVEQAEHEVNCGSHGGEW